MTVLNIKEMKCNHCVDRIHKLLEELKVEHTIDLENKTVTVVDDSKVDQVIDELDDIGFTTVK